MRGNSLVSLPFCVSPHSVNSVDWGLDFAENTYAAAVDILHLIPPRQVVSYPEWNTANCNGVACFVFPSQSDLSVWGIPYSFSSTSNIWKNPYKILVNGKKKKDLKTGYRVWTHLYVWLYTHSSRNTTQRKIFGTPKMFPGIIVKFWNQSCFVFFPDFNIHRILWSIKLQSFSFFLPFFNASEEVAISIFFFFFLSPSLPLFLPPSLLIPHLPLLALSSFPPSSSREATAIIDNLWNCLRELYLHKISGFPRYESTGIQTTLTQKSRLLKSVRIDYDNPHRGPVTRKGQKKKKKSHGNKVTKRAEKAGTKWRGGQKRI